jgi:hypothetical protein
VSDNFEYEFQLTDETVSNCVANIVGPQVRAVCILDFNICANVMLTRGKDQQISAAVRRIILNDS